MHLPVKFSLGVLSKDGAVVIKEPSKFQFNNKWICIVHGDYADLVFVIGEPAHFRLLKQSNKFDKTWMDYPKLETALNAQNF